MLSCVLLHFAGFAENGIFDPVQTVSHWFVLYLKAVDNFWF